MVEHASLRLHFHFARRTTNWDSIYEVEEFVRGCHAKVEDEVVFPHLKEILSVPNRDDFLKVISRLEADHKLIDTIGKQIRSRTAQGNDPETLRKRILLYATTVESHNSSEESLIFQFWQSGSEDKWITEKAMEIIREFGLNRYFQVTGISEKLISSLLH